MVLGDPATRTEVKVNVFTRALRGVVLLFLALFPSVHAGAVEIVLSGTTYGFELVEFYPPLKVSGTSFSEVKAEAAWLDCFVKARNYDRLSFAEWQGLSTERWLKEGAFNEEEFHQQSKRLHESGVPPVATCFYAITMSKGMERYFVVVSLDGKLVDSLEEGVGYEIFRESQGRVLRDSLGGDNAWLNMVSVLDLVKLREMMRPARRVVSP